MECEEIRVDLRTIPHSADRQRSAQLLFRLNHTLPFSEEYNALLRELLGKNLGEGSTIAPPLSGAALDIPLCFYKLYHQRQCQRPRRFSNSFL